MVSNLMSLHRAFSKCNKFVIGKKSAVGDKAASKRNENPISWARLAFATNPLITTEDADVQKARVCVSPL